jgi:hypothetical protein
MPITLDVKHLLSGRIRRVQRLLGPLAAHPIGCCFVANPNVRAKVISGHPGGSGHTDHTALWFPTSAADIQGQYYEIWYPLRDEERWWLERAYFSLRRVVRPLAKEEHIICLHCDPSAQDDEPLRTYKRGPHLHVLCVEGPMRKAHFPLNMGHLGQVLTSVDSLTAAMQSAISLIAHEVILRLKSTA